MRKSKDASELICVVLVIDDLEYGGAQRQVIELANNIDIEHFNVHICTLSDYIPLGNQLRDVNVRLHIIKKLNKVDFTVVPRLVKLLKFLNADIVHSFLFASDIASRLAGHFAGTKLIIGSERNANYSLKIRNKLAYKLTQKYVDLIIANSKTGANFNRKIFNQSIEKYRVVYNGVDTERFKPREKPELRKNLKLPVEDKIIGVFASFKPQKNHEMLIRAFSKVIVSIPETSLLFVGDQLYGNMNDTGQYHKKMECLIDELKIRNHCIFMGNRDDVEMIYPACDISILSSLYEGTPNVLLESMSCGVPVIATNVCDNSHIVKNGETGYLVDLNDINGMVQSIKKLLANNDLRQNMGKKARDWLTDEFSVNQLAKRMENIYLEALSEKL